MIGLAATVIGCQRNVTEEDVGEARLQITNVPADVGCVRITVAGSRTVVRNFDVMVGQAATFALTGLPLGSVTFTAEAFMTACASVGAADLGVWISDPVMATLVTSSVADVALVMHRNGRASVSVGFSDDPDGGGAPDSGTPADMGTPMDMGMPVDTRDGPPPCQITDPNDLPDLSFVDTNCDGIDGTAANAIFVATTGNDMNAGTMMAPKRTIAAAITAAAASTPIRNVYVAGGDYGETVVLASGVSIFGGFNAATGWSRSLATVTSISGGNPALRAENLTGLVEVQLFTIAGAPAMVPGDSGYGAFVVNSNVVFRRCTIRAGGGGGGLSGASGIAGSNGTPGSAGGVGQSNGSGGGVGGVNGMSSCGALAGRGGLGGFDGPGQAGLPSSSGAAAGGVGGAVSSMCTVRAANGLPGAAGPPGANGVNGPVAAPGSLLISGFVPGTGFPGNPGQPGSGGGGGGGGGGGRSATIICNADRGGGGGGGGAGGCPGGAGQAGRGGGGSFAVFSFSSAVQLLDCTLLAAAGGIGGRGGDAGTAGPSAAGAPGGAGADDSGNGGPGGNGGPAGPSGAGSGGAGGASACVVFRGIGPMAPGLTCMRAPGAPGGAGGFSNLGTAAAGPVGQSVDILSL